MRYIINCIQNYAASLLIACCIITMGVACSSKVGSSTIDAGSGGVCGDGICDYNEDEFSCSQDCTSGPECSYECGADGEVHYCDEAGNDASYACPEPLGSSCVSGQDFLGCSCGNITALGSCYSDGSLNVDLVRCESGFAQFFYCSDGSFCDDSDGQAQCYCDDASDGICPDAACVDDPDCAQCTPNCAGSVCGDNGCGGSCGSCQPSQSCQSGSCQSSCTPDCGGKTCGSDGCGGSCGPPCSLSCPTCEGLETCNTSTGTCECDFFTRFKYTFDASMVNWSGINSIGIRIDHIDSVGEVHTTNIFLNNQTASASQTYARSCFPDATIRRNYSLSGGVGCVFTDDVSFGDGHITIPTIDTNDNGDCVYQPLGTE